jgi:hypothetical protein
VKDSRSGITGLWPVPVWLGQLDRSAFGPPTGWALGGSGTADRLPFVPEVQAAALDACSSSEGTGWSWNCAIEQWRSGFFVGARHSDGAVRVVVILASNVEDEHPDSGALWIHDPRDGAGNVALPGLPWGRPLKLPGRAGLALAVPGWLRWSVAPLRAPHAMTVWTANASRLPNQERTVTH